MDESEYIQRCRGARISPHLELVKYCLGKSIPDTLGAGTFTFNHGNLDVDTSAANIGKPIGGTIRAGVFTRHEPDDPV